MQQKCTFGQTTENGTLRRNSGNMQRNSPLICWHAFPTLQPHPVCRTRGRYEVIALWPLWSFQRVWICVCLRGWASSLFQYALHTVPQHYITTRQCRAVDNVLFEANKMPSVCVNIQRDGYEYIHPKNRNINAQSNRTAQRPFGLIFSV